MQNIQILKISTQSADVVSTYLKITYLYLLKKKHINVFLTPIEKEIKIIGNKKALMKIKREILSDPQIGQGIFTMLASMILPALISALAK